MRLIGKRKRIRRGLSVSKARRNVTVIDTKKKVLSYAGPATKDEYVVLVVDSGNCINATQNTVGRVCEVLNDAHVRVRFSKEARPLPISLKKLRTAVSEEERVTLKQLYDNSTRFSYGRID